MGNGETPEILKLVGINDTDYWTIKKEDLGKIKTAGNVTVGVGGAVNAGLEIGCAVASIFCPLLLIPAEIGAVGAGVGIKEAVDNDIEEQNYSIEDQKNKGIIIGYKIVETLNKAFYCEWESTGTLDKNIGQPNLYLKFKYFDYVNRFGKYMFIMLKT